MFMFIIFITLNEKLNNFTGLDEHCFKWLAKPGTLLFSI